VETCWSGRIGPSLTPANHPANQINKVNRSTWVCAAAIIFIFCFCFVSSKPTQAQDQAQQNLRSYTVSVQQLKVSPQVRERLFKAEKRFRKADLSGAFAELQHALSEDPQCAQALTMRALLKLAAKDPAGAIADARQATLLDGNDAGAFLALATAFNSHKDYEQAEQAARQALSLEPDSWQAHLEVAKSLYGERKPLAALGELDNLQIDFADVHLVRGDVLMLLGHKQEAAHEFAEFLNEAPLDPRGEQVKQIVKNVSLPRSVTF
jgi:tetratricopeptide (TPR) repeat protein